MKKHKKIILIGIIFILMITISTIESNGDTASEMKPLGIKTTWSEYLNKPEFGLRGVTKIIKAEDDSEILVGYYSDELKLPNGQIFKCTSRGWQSFIIKLNKNREIEWAKAISGSGSSFIYDAKKTDDNKYLVTGNFGGDIIIDEGKELKDNSSDSIFQIEYNPDGSIQSYKSKGFNTSENGYVRVDNIKILEDNSLIVDGTYQEKMIYDNGQELNDNTDEYIDYITKLNKNLEVEWIKQLKKDGNIYDEIQKKNGDILITIEASSEGKGFQFDNQPEVIGLDYKTYNCTLSGDVTEVNNIVLQNINESYYNIYAMNDGGYSVIEYYTENKKINKSVITKYRSNNTIEWTKEVSIENYGAVINLNQIDDNNYAMVLFYAGSDPKIKIGEKNVTIHKNFKTGFESDDSKFMGTVIAKLDNNGDLIYSKCMENFQIENFLNKDKDKFFVLGLSLGTILDNGKLYEPGSYVMIDFDEYYNELDAPPVPTPTEEPTPNVPTLEPSDSPTSKPSESPSVAPTQHTKNPSQQEVSPNDSDNDSSNGDNSLTLDDYYKKASKDKYDDANGSANIDSSDTTYKNVPSESPDTGDTIIISIIILAISFIGTIVILAIKIRNKE